MHSVFVYADPIVTSGCMLQLVASSLRRGTIDKTELQHVSLM